MSLHHTRIIWVAAAAVLLLMTPVYSIAQDVSPEEIKASYIIKMRPFITLGNASRPAQKICYYERPGVALNDSVGQIIAKYLQKSPGSGMSVQAYKAVQDFSSCDIFFIPADEEANVTSILAALDSSATLTVSAVPRFINKGGMIGFVTDDKNRIRMEASVKNSKAKGVRIDAQILEIMQRVDQ